MILDAAAPNPAFPDGRLPGEDLIAVMEWARARLGLDASRPWKLISARSKLSKTLFEIEEERPSGAVRLIAKISSDERTRVTFEALRSLWNAGFCPPSRYTVVEPLAWFEERHLVILERAPGVELVEKVQARDAAVPDLIRETATWLLRLHAAPVPVEPWAEKSLRLDQWTDAGIAPDHSDRIRRIAQQAEAEIGGHRDSLVPCHGDFHLLNMFVADSGRLTGIDVDKFGGRERAEEVGYFLAQTASIGFHRLGSFAETTDIRDLFLRSYEDGAAVLLDRRRMGAHMAATLIKNLHFDLFTYHSGRLHILDPWLDAAARCLDGDLTLA
jgi:aminoglycoside phosphotransferase